MNSTSRTTIAVIAASLSMLGLAACSTDEPAPTPRPSTSASASASPSAEPDGDPAESTSSPVGIGCAELITLEELYAFNPNYSLLNNFTPAAGSLAATAVAEQGVACQYINQSSGETVVISVALPGEERLTAIAQDQDATGTAAPELGAQAWFAAGTAQGIQDGYWVTATSDLFYSAADAEQLFGDVLTKL